MRQALLDKSWKAAETAAEAILSLSGLEGGAGGGAGGRGNSGTRREATQGLAEARFQLTFHELVGAATTGGDLGEGGLKAGEEEKSGRGYGEGGALDTAALASALLRGVERGVGGGNGGGAVRTGSAHHGGDEGGGVGEAGAAQRGQHLYDSFTLLVKLRGAMARRDWPAVKVRKRKRGYA
jgi:hypothetical protein